MEAKQVKELMEVYASVYTQPQEVISEAECEEEESDEKETPEMNGKKKGKKGKQEKEEMDEKDEEMKEEVEVVDEGRTTSLSALSRESEQRKADKKRGRPEAEVERDSRLMMGRFRPGASQDERAEGGREVLKARGKVPKKGGKDMFEHILEHLVAEGYADTNKAALAIMANMSEEWKQSIVEGEEGKEEPQKPFTGEGPKKPKGWKPTGPKLKSGQRPGYAR